MSKLNDWAREFLAGHFPEGIPDEPSPATGVGPREWAAVRRYATSGLSLAEVGRECSMSRERVRMVLARVVKALGPMKR